MSHLVSLTAKKSHVYGNRRRAVGDEFTANRQDARLLVALGRAQETDGMKAEKKPAAKTPAKPKAKPAAKKVPQSRGYKRRDVKPSVTK